MNFTEVLEGTHLRMGLPYHPATLIVSGAGCALIAVLGTIGNLLAIISLMSSPRLRRSSTYYLVNLAVSNMPMCLIAMPLMTVCISQISLYGQIIVRDEVVQGFVILGFICNQAELQTISVLGFNRALAMTKPRLYQKLVQMKCYIWVLIGVWVYSVLLWLPLATGIFGKLDVTSRDLLLLIGEAGSVSRRFYLFVAFLLPVTFSLVCHMIILCKGTCLGGSSDLASQQQWRHHVTKTVCLVFLLLLILSVPHAVVHALHPAYVDMPNNWLLMHLLFYTRYVLDPTVFVVTSSEYRRAFIETLVRVTPFIGSSTVTGGLTAPPCTPATSRHKIVDLSALDLTKLHLKPLETKKALRFPAITSHNRRNSPKENDPHVLNSLMAN